MNSDSATSCMTLSKSHFEPWLQRHSLKKTLIVGKGPISQVVQNTPLGKHYSVSTVPGPTVSYSKYGVSGHPRPVLKNNARYRAETRLQGEHVIG